MENFLELLDQYIDEEAMKEKFEADEVESIKEEKKKTASKYKHDFSNTINIRDFVNKYLGTDHDCDNLRHIGLKSFENPYVIGLSNDFALKYPEFIENGCIVIVLDSVNNPGAYINPSLIKTMEEVEYYKLKEKEVKKTVIMDFKDVKNLYDQYVSVNNKLTELTPFYLLGVEMLKLARKLNILRDIRNEINLKNNNNNNIEEGMVKHVKF